MSKPKVFFLLDAVLALYPVAPGGDSLISAPIWFGACAERLRLNSKFTGPRLASTGDRYREQMQTDEEHTIEIERLWALQRPAITDWTPVRNQRYALEVLWTDSGAFGSGACWYKRTYYGVKLHDIDIGSNGVHEFGSTQSFSAERFVTASAAETYLGAAIVGTLGAEYPVAFVKPGQLISSDLTERYLSGHYRWSGNLEIVDATVIGRAGQTTPTVFQMEVNGVLIPGTEVTMPAGAVNAEVTGTATFTGVTTAAGTTIKWRAISGPAAFGDCPWDLTLMMTVRQG